MNTTRLWTKDFLTGTFTNFFLVLNYYLLVVIMTVFAMDEFGASPSLAGFASSIFVIGTLAARLICGKWIERMGRKKMLLIGAVLSLLMSLLYFFVNNIWILFLVRALHGLAYGAGATAIGIIVTHIIPKERQGEGIGYYMLSVTLASAVGPFLGMFMIQHGGYPSVFIVCAVSAVLSMITTLCLKAPEVRLTKEQLGEMKEFKLSNFFETKVISIGLVCGGIYFCYSSILSFLTPFAKETHLVGAASFFFIVYSLSILLSRPFTGRLFDRKGANITMLPAFLAFTIGMILLSQAYHGAIILLAAVFVGLGVGVVQACGLAIAIKVTPHERLSFANSTFYMCLDMGIGIGPLVLGILIPFTGYRWMYGIMALIALLCAFFYYITYGRKLRKER